MAPEDVMQAITNPVVIDALCNKLSDRLLPVFEKRLTSLISNMNDQLASLSTRIAGLEGAVNSLSIKTKIIDSNHNILETKVRELERYTRMDNLVFHGLEYGNMAEAASSVPAENLDDSEVTINPRPSHPTTEQVVINFVRNTLRVPIARSDISIAHRLPARNTGNNQADRKTQIPIIVKFTNRNIRLQILQNRKILKNTHKYVNEHLTSSDAEIFKESRKLVTKEKINKCWTFNGLTFVKRTEHENPVKINYLSELSQFK